jgi:putative membrane protein
MPSETRPANALTSQSPQIVESGPSGATTGEDVPASQAPGILAGSKKASTESVPNLQLMNTLMAADRTLMAWTRTSLSLLSFGFTIYKILQGFQDVEGKFVVRTDVPRNAGLFLTGMGTLAMVMGTVEYCQTLRTLHQTQIFERPRASLVMALIMSLMGLLLFFSIIAKVL